MGMNGVFHTIPALEGKHGIIDLTMEFCELHENEIADSTPKSINLNSLIQPAIG
jgi:hypothetical protein